jgi:hypothetical protein
MGAPLHQLRSNTTALLKQSGRLFTDRGETLGGEELPKPWTRPWRIPLTLLLRLLL